jgi:aromatic ring hydroxylase
VNPPVDRNKEIHEVDDVFIHAVKETDAGVVVSGSVEQGSPQESHNLSIPGDEPVKTAKEAAKAPK